MLSSPWNMYSLKQQSNILVEGTFMSHSLLLRVSFNNQSMTVGQSLIVAIYYSLKHHFFVDGRFFLPDHYN